MSKKEGDEDSMEEGELEDGEIEDEHPPSTAHTRDNYQHSKSYSGPTQFHNSRQRKFTVSHQPPRTAMGGFWVGMNTKNIRPHFSGHTSPGARLLAQGGGGRVVSRGRPQQLGRQPGRMMGPRPQFEEGLFRGGGRGHTPTRGGKQNRPGRGRGFTPRGAHSKNVPQRRNNRGNFKHYKDIDRDEDERMLVKNQESFEELLKEHQAIRAKIEALNQEEEKTRESIAASSLNIQENIPSKNNKSNLSVAKGETSGDRSAKGQRARRGRSRSRSKSGPPAKTVKSPDVVTPVSKKVDLVDEDDDEMSELQLRLIALASATEKVTNKAEEEEAERQVLEEEIRASEVTETRSESNDQDSETLLSPRRGDSSKKITRRERSRRMKKKVQAHKRHEEERKRKEAAEIRGLQNEDEQFSRFLKFVGKDEKEIQSRKEATEIRKLTNENEKFERFMKFVQREELEGSTKRRLRSSSRESDSKAGTHPKEVTISENDPEFIFQFDNYEEVEMDVDSSENSSLISPSPIPFISGAIDQSRQPTGTHSYITEQPYKESENLTTADHHDNEDEEEDMLALREQLLKSMIHKRVSKTTNESSKIPMVQQSMSSPHSVRSMSPTTSVRSIGSPNIASHSVTTKAAPRKRNVQVTSVNLPKHDRVVITLGNDSDTSDESDTEQKEQQNTTTSGSTFGFMGGIDMFLKEARKTADASKAQTHSSVEQTPDAVNRLSADQKAEYRRLKQEIAVRELRRRLEGGKSNSATASPNESDLESQEEFVAKEIVTKRTLPKRSVAKETVAIDNVVKKTVTKENVAMETITQDIVAKKLFDAGKDRQELMQKAQEYEQKVTNSRKVLQRDEAIVVKLDTQITKKQSAVQFIETRIEKLKEQLKATEDMRDAQSTMLKKFQENRAAIKSRIKRRSELEGKLITKLNKTRKAAGLDILAFSHFDVTDRIEQKVDRTLRVAEKKTKPVPITSGVSKITADSLAKEKERLQRLEREFAEKIKILREAQTQKDANIPVAKETNVESGAVQRLAEIKMQSASLKPSMQEYKKDKICFDVAVETDEGTDVEEGPVTKRRRTSLIEMNPSTKPNLGISKDNLGKGKDGIRKDTTGIGKDTTGIGKDATGINKDITDELKRRTDQDKQNMTDVKEDVDISVSDKENKATRPTSSKVGKQTRKETSKKTLDFSLPSVQQLERLKRLQHEKEKVVKVEPMWMQCIQERTRDYLLLPKLALEIPDTRTSVSDTKEDVETPLHFQKYQSTLLHFKGYRFSPYYRTKAKLSLTSSTYSNKIRPQRVICRFGLTGTCNDDHCPWQHSSDYLLSTDEVNTDIVSYSPTLCGIHNTDNVTEYEDKVSKYVQGVHKQNGDKMTPDQLCLLFVSKVNDHLKHVAPHTMIYDPRKWKPTQSIRKQQTKDDLMNSDIKMPDKPSRQHKSHLDVTYTSDDPRYFTTEATGVQQLEAAVLENPLDVQLWLKLAYKQLSGRDKDSIDSLDKALNILSRGLESNGSNTELWQHYLTLFSKRGNSEELQEMCQAAVQFAPHYDVWTKWLQVERTFAGKDDVCKKILEFLVKKQDEDMNDLQSHQLIETLFYRVHLHIQTRRYSIALNLFSTAISEKSGSSSTCSGIGQYLTPSDRCLAWLSFIYLTQFHTLPPSLYDPANSNPDRIVSKDPFILPWTEESDLNPEVLLGYFQSGLDACTTNNQQPPEVNTMVCMPLYKNVLKMKTILGRYDAAETLLRQLLKDTPSVVELWLLLADLKIQSDQSQQVRQVFKEAILENPASTELYYSAASYEYCQHSETTAKQLLEQCVMTMYDTSDFVQPMNTLDMYRKILGQTVSLESELPPLAKDISQLPTHQQVYLWLNYCLLLELNSDNSGTVEAFETALYAVKNYKDVQRVWIQYLKYQCRKTISSERDKRLFTDLVNRCLVTMATQFHPPFSSTSLWSDYSFHNNVIEMYLSCVKEEYWSGTYERLLRMMPNNAVLALRACQHELKKENLRETGRICSTFLAGKPNSLPLWKVAISLELKGCNYKETHRMYWKATQSLPFSATLWKDFILFEVAHSNRAEDVKDVIEACQQIGIHIEDYIATIMK
ncbi:zinc finger C3H1 domain-containing protein-like [Glandiceps talaboti]